MENKKERFKKRFGVKCDTHPSQTRGYIEWHEWAAEQEKNGITQMQCKICGHYFYPTEF